MKMNLVLLVSVLACASALPDCSREKANSCKEAARDINGPPETREEMDKYCRVYPEYLHCLSDFNEKCPNNQFIFDIGDTLKDVQRGIRLICDKKNPLREKYIANAVCFNYVINHVPEFCGEAIRFDKLTKEERCRRVREEVKCVENTVLHRCGKDAKEVLDVTHITDYELKMADCL